jgi:hypothetical protein
MAAISLKRGVPRKLGSTSYSWFSADKKWWICKMVNFGGKKTDGWTIAANLSEFSFDDKNPGYLKLESFLACHGLHAHFRTRREAVESLALALEGVAL